LDIPRPGSLAPSVWPRLWTRPDVGVGKVCWDISQHGGALEGSFRGAVLFDTFVCFHLDLACLDRNPIAYASLDVGTRANPANQPVSDPLPYIAQPAYQPIYIIHVHTQREREREREREGWVRTTSSRPPELTKLHEAYQVQRFFRCALRAGQKTADIDTYIVGNLS